MRKIDLVKGCWSVPQLVSSVLSLVYEALGRLIRGDRVFEFGGWSAYWEIKVSALSMMYDTLLPLEAMERVVGTLDRFHGGSLRCVLWSIPFGVIITRFWVIHVLLERKLQGSEIERI